MKFATIALGGILFATASSEYISGFKGCTGDQKKSILTAWQDAVHLAQYAHKTIYTSDDAGLGFRYFGKFANDDYGRYLQALPKTKLRLINLWYNSWFPPWDWWGGREKYILVSCDDVPNKKGVKCSNKGQHGKIGAYALSENGPTIVFCEPFFDVPSLKVVHGRLDGELKHKRKELWWMKNQGAIFLHEMSHLRVIGRSRSDPKNAVDIIDYNFKPGDEISHKVYGPGLCEKFAIKQSEFAGRNADNYAWYATAVWFKYFFGVPDIPYVVSDTSEDQLPTAEDGPSMDVFGELGSLEVGELTGTADPALSRKDMEEMIKWAEENGLEKNVPQISGNVSGKKLRILALGDSITNGFKSSDNLGYRGPLGNLLAGNTISIINEGHNGAVISEIANFAKNSLPNRPNVVLLHAGTNDINTGADVTASAASLSSLIDQIGTACPDASILVSLIIPASGIQSRVDTYNTLVKKVLTDKAQNGKHVDLVDMTEILGAGDMADGLHPNDSGYAKMAQAWLESIKRANSFGWVKDPVQGGGGNGNACTKNPNWIPQGYIASGADNGSALPAKTTCSAPVCVEKTYADFSACMNNCSSGMCTEKAGDPSNVCTSCPKDPTTIEPTKCICSTAAGKRDVVDNPLGGPCSALSTKGYNAVHFADLDGDRRDDYLWVTTDGKVRYYRNIGLAPDEGANAGKIQYQPHGVIATGIGATGDQIRFADIDGDGRAEYIWVKDSGAATVRSNGGFDASKNPKVNWFPGTGEEIASGIGDGAGVRFADMNGDGKADFIHLAKDGAMKLYMNQGRQGSKWGWWDWGTQATGVGYGRSNIRFADLNGDGRADYLTFNSDTGAVYAWTNNGVANGNWGTVSKIIWYNRKGSDPVATGMSYLDSWSDGSMISFGDLNKDGRDELLYVGAKDSSVYAYLNGCEVLVPGLREPAITRPTAGPLTVVGIIANIVQLIDFSTQVLARLNDFQSSFREILKAFRHIKAELPVLQETLKTTKGKIDHGSIEDSTKAALVPAVQGCKVQIKTLDNLLAETLPVASGIINIT
ncbi:hypothetical protein VE04_08544 [Pseudogymnoascus sp. 24MN13]|nr:hypothetical protein VE04_08544 [Pseudogymnoascus sp. 24MN13]